MIIEVIMKQVKVGDILPLFGKFSPEMTVTHIIGDTIYTSNGIEFLITDDDYTICVSRDTGENDREATITSSSGEKWATQFNSSNTLDSEAFKYLICMCDPGDNYTVEFSSTLSATPYILV